LLDRELDIFYQLLSLFNHFIIKDRLWLLLLGVLDLEEHVFHGPRLDQVGSSSPVGESASIRIDDWDTLISVSLLAFTLQAVHHVDEVFIMVSLSIPGAGFRLFSLHKH